MPFLGGESGKKYFVRKRERRPLRIAAKRGKESTARYISAKIGQ